MQDRLSYEINSDKEIIALPIEQLTTWYDFNQFLINIEHTDPDQSVEDFVEHGPILAEQEENTDKDPVIVAYRRQGKPSDRR